jgi:RHS repeat-associated protein
VGTGGGSKLFAVGYAWGTTGSSAGKLVSVSYPSGNRATYAYDGSGRVSGVTVNPVNTNGVGTNTGAYLNILSGVTYNGNNSLLTWTWADNAPYQRNYDTFGRLSTYPMGYPAGTGAAAGVTRTLSYDNGARINGYTHANTGGTQAALNQGFAYDNLDRITSQTTSSSSYGFTFDTNGNRTSRIVGATTFANTVDPTSNRLTQVQTGTTTPINNPQSYDAAGSIQGDGAATYVYSDRGRMSSATVSGGGTSYLYNGLDQRVSKTGALVPTGGGYYAYDEAGRLIGEYDANLTPVFETVYVGNMPVAILKEVGLAASSTLQLTVGNVYADHLDTPRVVTRNADEVVLWRWDTSEAFGATPPNENPSALGTYKLDQRFPGQVFDQETGLFQNGYRYYDGPTGRYRSFDPIGLAGGVNGYAYVNGGPTTRVDPLGLFNIVGQVGGSLVPGIGGEGYIGIYMTLPSRNYENGQITWTRPDIGVYSSGGVGAGWNIGVALGLGYVKGEEKDIQGVTYNVNVGVPPVGVSAMYDPDGKRVGVVFGPAADLGASGTYAETHAIGLRDAFGWLFDRIDPLGANKKCK